MTTRSVAILALGLALVSLAAADWPQWRGLNRDAKVGDFQAPTAWPKELTKKWKVTVGDGAATPALVGDKLYVFSREGGNEVIRCLDAASGNELWQEKYATQGSTDPGGFAGPRSSPAVTEGKVVTLCARGILSCFEAESGKKLWSKDEIRSWPMFFVSSSPIVVDGLCVAQLGGNNNNGSVVAFDLATGEQKWKWTGATPAYASPMLLNVDGTKLIIGQVSDGIVAVKAADGKHVWEVYFTGGGSKYKAATPIVDGDTLIYLDGPPKAVKLEKEGEKFVSKDQWSNKESRVEYNTPVLRDGFLYGLSQRNELFCVNIKDGSTAWSQAYPAPMASPAPSSGGGRRGGGGGGYGSVVDAGSVLIALNPSAQLIVYEPNEKEFKQLASYKVADKDTHAYPVVTGNRLFIKDKDSLTLWTVE